MTQKPYHNSPAEVRREIPLDAEDDDICLGRPVEARFTAESGATLDVVVPGVFRVGGPMTVEQLEPLQAMPLRDRVRLVATEGQHTMVWTDTEERITRVSPTSSLQTARNATHKGTRKPPEPHEILWVCDHRREIVARCVGSERDNMGRKVWHTGPEA
jgi:hypothetical protein